MSFARTTFGVQCQLNSQLAMIVFLICMNEFDLLCLLYRLLNLCCHHIYECLMVCGIHPATQQANYGRMYLRQLTTKLLVRSSLFSGLQLVIKTRETELKWPFESFVKVREVDWSKISTDVILHSSGVLMYIFPKN